MLRMDGGSKCTWYKFIKGEQKQSLLDGTNIEEERQFTAGAAPEKHIGNNSLISYPPACVAVHEQLI